ncbi:MAG: HEAT repeat domain-containing protein [Fuerstiella sp.]
MKFTLFTFLVLLAADVSSAGLFRIHSKGCSDGCPQLACEPVIARPTCTTIYSHQRRVSGTKCCGQEACGPASCCAPTACLGADCSAPELFCSSEPSCCVPSDSCCVEPSCAAAAGCCVGADGCGDGCGSGAACYSTEDCKVIATLIHRSMTGCYAKDRRRAVHRLGDHFDCVCHPEIMTAFVHALNDSDESVRQKAADEIGDQIRRNRVCIGQPVIKGLQCALADCDWAVRRQAEEALRLAGYRVVDGACSSFSPAHHQVLPTSSPAMSSPAMSQPAMSPPSMSPPQIHPEFSSESDVPTLQLLPEESEFSTDYKSDSSLKVLPVSSRLATKLKPITASILGKQKTAALNTVVPPPVPALEPVDYQPTETETADGEAVKPRRSLMKRLFGELRN